MVFCGVSSDNTRKVHAGNPGKGGWGALLQFDGEERKVCGGEMLTTNNRMELRAAIEALKVLKQTCEIDLTTDSSYVKNGITQWLAKWKTNNWLTSNRKPVKNIDLWQELDELTQKHSIRWHWIKGHSGHIGNESADKLANKGIDEL